MYNKNNTEIIKDKNSRLHWVLSKKIFLDEDKKPFKKVLWNDYKTSGMVIYL